MSDSGKRLEREFKKGCKDAGFWVERIRDNTYYSKTRIRSQKTPADFNITTPYQSWLVECKAVKGKSLPFKRVADHQRTALTNFNNIGGIAKGVVVINMYGERRKFNRLFMLTIDKFEEYSMICNRKSIPLCWLEENALELKKEKSIWILPSSI